MSIPDIGKRFRLLNYQSEEVLVANKNGKLTDFNKHTVYNDQIFELISAPGGLFYIQSVYVGDKYRIFSTSGAVGVRNTDASNARFSFEEGSGPLKGYYRLVTPSEGLVITDKSGHLPGNYHSGGEKYEDQYFEFQTGYGEVTKSTEA